MFELPNQKIKNSVNFYQTFYRQGLRRLKKLTNKCSGTTFPLRGCLYLYDPHMTKTVKSIAQNPETEMIEVFGAREHNLKNIDISIPKNNTR